MSGEWRAKEERSKYLTLFDKAAYRVKLGRALPLDILLVNTESRVGNNIIVKSLDLVLGSIPEVSEDDLLFLSNYCNSNPLLASYWRAVKMLRSALISSPKIAPGSIGEDIREHIRDNSRKELQELRRVAVERVSEDPEYWLVLIQEIDRQLCIKEFTEIFNTVLAKRLSQLVEYEELTEHSLVKANEQAQGPCEQDEFEQKKSHLLGSLISYKDLEYIPSSSASSKPEPKHVAVATFTTKWSRYYERKGDSAEPPPLVCDGLYFLLDYRPCTYETPVLRISSDPQCTPALPGDTSATKLITFAAPNFASVQFRIPGHEWESNQRKGYVSVFSEGFLTIMVKLKRLEKKTT